MKKKIIFCILIIVCLFFILKIREILIINKVCESIKRFNNENNRKLEVCSIVNQGVCVKKSNLIKDNTECFIINTKNTGEFIVREDYSNNETITYNTTKKIKYKNDNDIDIDIEKSLIGIPKSIIDLIEQKNVIKIFKIHYIIPITYEDKKCYKIATNSEIVIIDKNTYLPVYSTSKIANSKSKDNKVEYKYKFEVGTVTDEEVALPDFSDYEIE